jgi:hypothetical protein
MTTTTFKISAAAKSARRQNNTVLSWEFPDIRSETEMITGGSKRVFITG